MTDALEGSAVAETEGHGKQFPLSGGPLTWLCVEILVAVLGVTVIPNSWLLASYLPRQSIESTAAFVNGDALLIPDAAAGWQNAPNKTQGKWHTDSIGARPPSKQVEHPAARRVIMMGSSTMNGGTAVTNDETIAAYLDSDSISTVNAGVMLYSFDQILLAYREHFASLNASVIVVGYDPLDVSGLTNMYIPLRRPDEVNMPYAKPRFERVTGDSLQLVPIDSRDELRGVPANSAIIDRVRQHDGDYSAFGTYSMLGIMPIAASIRQALIRAESILRRVGGERSETGLLLLLVGQFVADANSHGAHVVLLTLPEVADVARGALRKRLPDSYGSGVHALVARGVDILDARAVFYESKLATSELYSADGVHFTPRANKLIADAIRRHLVH